MKRHLEYIQFQGIGMMSKIIQHWTRDTDSHSAVLDREKHDGQQIIEQWPHKGGSRSYMGYSDFSAHNVGTPYQIWSLEVSEFDYDWVMNEYRRSAAKQLEYDWSGIIGFGFHGSGDPDKTFCSEEMITHLAICMGWTQIRPETISPGMFRNLLQAAGAKPTIKGVV